MSQIVYLLRTAVSVFYESIAVTVASFPPYNFHSHCFSSMLLDCIPCRQIPDLSGAPVMLLLLIIRRDFRDLYLKPSLAENTEGISE